MSPRTLGGKVSIRHIGKVSGMMKEEKDLHLCCDFEVTVFDFIFLFCQK